MIISDKVSLLLLQLFFFRIYFRYFDRYWIYHPSLWITGTDKWSWLKWRVSDNIELRIQVIVCLFLRKWTCWIKKLRNVYYGEKGHYYICTVPLFMLIHRGIRSRKSRIFPKLIHASVLHNVNFMFWMMSKTVT